MMEEERSITIVKSEKQERALELMLRGETDTQIAKAMKITRQTLYYWRTQDARFMKALAERRSILREQTREELLELSHAATEAVRKALASKDERIQLQAAKMVLNMLKIDKEDELEESPILELLGQAIEGIKDRMGLNKLL
jgi:transposase-like protein